jgi:N-acetylglucosaminyl-diphospho-decaprenol L-rhamnosyltransferase
MFVRREALDAVRGFDARCRFYFEDVDLCVRLWAAQWSIVYDPTVVLRHEHGAGSRKTLLGWAMRQHMRGAAKFYRRYPRLVTAAGRRAARRR